MNNGSVVIKVFGVGGAGCNAINRMIESKIKKAKIYAVNTDAQDLAQTLTKNKIVLGTLGAGSNPEVGRESALNCVKEIEKAVKGSDLVFITCGEGGGTGTGAAPIVAKAAKEAGALTIAVVSKPFKFEGLKRTKQAEEGIEELKKWTDSIIVVSNERLLETLGTIPIKESFKESDNVLKRGVQAIIDLIYRPTLINLDFADIKAAMTGAGSAVIGIGASSGDNRVIEATKLAMASPLLDIDLKTATKAIVNITGDKDISLIDIGEAMEEVRKATRDDIEVTFGTSTETGMKNSAIVTVILTGVTDKNVSGYKANERKEPKVLKLPKEDDEPKDTIELIIPRETSKTENIAMKTEPVVNKTVNKNKRSFSEIITSFFFEEE